MFYHLLYPLREFFFAFNVFGYISFRAVGAALTALIISFLFGPKIIRTLQSRQIGETIRLDGPESHLNTMPWTLVDGFSPKSLNRFGCRVA